MNDLDPKSPSELDRIAAELAKRHQESKEEEARKVTEFIVTQTTVMGE